jgi:hypothetical protein
MTLRWLANNPALYFKQPDHLKMKTIIKGFAGHAHTCEEPKAEVQKTTKSADKRISSESEIERTERYFKTLREIEFTSLRIC